ncbi:MAG: alpha/beta fold hydrolase [Proteobacteria bacterium]|nr:alpha/beta fold hydrolase [Pseudomonadota bacterium]
MARARPNRPDPQAVARRPRLGPRPLPLHLATAALTWLNSLAALAPSKSGSPGWKQAPSPLGLPWQPMLEVQATPLMAELAGVDPVALAAAVGREVRRRLDELERGIRRYRQHPYRRDLDEPPAIWQDGTTRLRDYGALSSPGTRGKPLLVVPSLINRAYILDLSSNHSLLRFLAAAGFRPFLVDWGAPGEAEQRFDLSEYILGRLGAALDRVIAIAGERPAIIGYCMGGLLALALADARAADICGLALLATPWDFHAERGDLGRALAKALAPWLPMIDRLGGLPVDALQAMFFGLDPFLVARKFRAFARLDTGDPRATEFVALEDWLNDGVPLAGPVARECLLGWYGDNTPARGAWRVGGKAVRPQAVGVPSLVVLPEQDRIVPPASAAALARTIPGARSLSLPLGHIGMMAGSRARTAMWLPLAAWLASGELAAYKPR